MCSKCGSQYGLKAAPGTDVILCHKCFDEYELLRDVLIKAARVTAVELNQIAAYAILGRTVHVLTRDHATADRIGRVVMNTGYEIIAIKRDKVVELPL